ncbi:MAG: hypothetical protein ACW98Y_04260, partial [Candidatus Thorarchaeota archaeon]
VVIIIIILCYACQFLTASAEKEVADRERREIQKQVQGGAATTRRIVPSLVQDAIPFSTENASLFDRHESQSRFPNGKLCANCEKRFLPIANESGFYKCPFCGKAYIL